MKRYFTFLLLFFSLKSFSQIPTDGLIAYYPFNGNTLDMSGNGYNGSNNGATPTKNRFGMDNSAYSFNGISNFIDISSHVSSLNFAEPSTFSFWIKTNQDNGQTVFSVSDGTSGSFNSAIFIGNNITSTLTNEIALASHKRNDDEFYIAGFTTTKRDTMIDNNWHHLVYIFNGTSTEIYLDNKLMNIQSNFGTNNGNFGNITNAARVLLGARNANGLGFFLNGSLDDFRIYNRVLSKNELTALYYENFCFESISVTDTLIINSNLVSYDPIQFSNTIKIYPNPTNDHIYIVSNENSLGYQIKIINTMSQTVFETKIDQSQYYLDLNSWTGKGTYFIQFIDPAGLLLDIKKIVLQ
jgi:hypothetical protein